MSETSDGYQDGTYTGTGTGFSGPITVQVVIQDGKITEITILNTDDSPYIENASALLKTIIATQSTNVDTVSGATYSSVGLISAVRDALKKAGGSSASDTVLPVLNGQSSTASESPSLSAISEPSVLILELVVDLLVQLRCRLLYLVDRLQILLCSVQAMTVPILIMLQRCSVILSHYRVRM